VDDYGKVRIYNASCPSLPVLLRRLRSTKAPAGLWRRALEATLDRMGRHRQESLARATAAEILAIASTLAASNRHLRSDTARAQLRELHMMRKRRYRRGELTPAGGHNPEVLELWLRRSTKILTPLKRLPAEAEWRRRGGGRFPAALWDDLQASKSAAGRARLFVAAMTGCDVKSLDKTLQRHRRARRTANVSTVR
jgi:hypothetical protein